jgi:uncharacterized protein
MHAPVHPPARLTVNGAVLLADRSGVAVAEACGTLIVADLHLEKGSAFAARGVPLPPYDTRATIRRLAETVARLAPSRVVALGDSFHDLGADGRMHAADADALAALVGAVPEWIWIEGNHDPEPPARFGGRTLPELALGPLLLRHEPAVGSAPGEVAGHLHPCAKVSAGGRTVRRRCFLSDGARLILPAFGAYAGGLNACDAAYEACFPVRPDAWMVGRDRVYRVPGRRLLAD